MGIPFKPMDNQDELRLSMLKKSSVPATAKNAQPSSASNENEATFQGTSSTINLLQLAQQNGITAIESASKSLPFHSKSAHHHQLYDPYQHMNTPTMQNFTSMNFVNDSQVDSAKAGPEDVKADILIEQGIATRHNRNNSQRIRSQERQYTFNDEAEPVIVEAPNIQMMLVQQNDDSPDRRHSDELLNQDLMVGIPNLQAAELYHSK